MANVAVTNTFSANTTIESGQMNTNLSDLVTYINNRNTAAADWEACHVTTADRVPMQIDNSTGANSIAIFQDNGTAVMTIADGGVITTTGAQRGPNGSASVPTWSFSTDTDTGFYLQGAGVVNYAVGGASVLQLEALEIFPNTTNAVTLGKVGSLWSDVRSTLINGADYGFANGYVLREYPCTSEDVQTKSPEWMKESANLGIQVLNDKAEMICVIGRDGTIYANQFKPLSELSN